MGNRTRFSMLIIYASLVCLIAVSVLLFALLYRGEGANILRDAVSEFDVALANAQALDIEPTPAPTPTPVPISLRGRIIPYYDNASGFWGYKNTAGQVVIQARFDVAYEFADNIAFASEGGLFGLLSINNVWLVEPIWSNVLTFSEGYAAVEYEDKWGFINSYGELVIDYQFREVGSFHCGRAIARTNSSYGYIDVRGNMAISSKWRRANDFSEDLAFAVSDEYEKDRMYIINKVGEKVATLGSTISGISFSEGFAAVSEGGKYYYFNSSGSSAFQATFDGAKNFSQGLAAVKSGGSWGYINNRGVVTIDYQFTEAGDFTADGLAAAKDSSSGKWGYINSTGNFVILPQYDEAQDFSGGYALAAAGDMYYILDIEGNSQIFYAK